MKTEIHSGRRVSERRPKPHYLDVQPGLDRVLPGKIIINGLQRAGMKILLSTFRADLGADILDDIQCAVQPVLPFDVFLSCFSLAEFAFH